MSDRTGYSALQITLHWLIAGLITAAWFTDDGMGRALKQRLEGGASGFDGNTLHVWLGSAALVLILVRIIVRLAQGAPDPLPGTSGIERAAAIWGHRLLYLLMIAAPALGAAAWYGGLRTAGDLHETAANALMLVALGHAAVAIWHQYARKDGALTRILRPQR